MHEENRCSLSELADFFLTPRLGEDGGVSVAQLYGTEHFCLWLNAHARMSQPEVIVEVGTGACVATAFLADAVKTNKRGHIWTIDNGSDWERLIGLLQSGSRPIKACSGYSQFVFSLLEKFQMTDCVTFLNQDCTLALEALPETIDLVFADAVDADVVGCQEMLCAFLPRLSHDASLFLDRVPTLNHSHLFLEYVIRELSRGKIPCFFREQLKGEYLTRLETLVERCNFQLIPLVERAAGKLNRQQNSRAWVRVSTADFTHKNGVDNYL